MTAPRVRSVLAALLVLACSGPVRAAAPRGPAPHDPGAIPLIMPFVDPFDGLAWRGDQFHPLPMAEVPPPPAPEVGAAFRDVRWGYRRVDHPQGIWRAELAPTAIRTGAVGRAILYLNPFSPKLSHLALGLELPPGAMLRLDDGTSAPELVLSVEARVRAGEAYDPKAAAFGTYPIVYNLGTGADFRQQCVDLYRTPLQPYVLDLTPAERLELLRLTLQAAAVPRRDERYLLTRNNCTTSVMDLVVGAIAARLDTPAKKAAFRRKLLGGWVVHPGMSFPDSALRFLDRRGLIAERLPDLTPPPR